MNLPAGKGLGHEGIRSKKQGEVAGKGGCIASRQGSAQVEPDPGVCGFKRSPCGHLCRPSWRGRGPAAQLTPGAAEAEFLEDSLGRRVV